MRNKRKTQQNRKNYGGYFMPKRMGWCENDKRQESNYA